MIYWAPFLHFYQPPTQSHDVLERICRESYRPLLKVLRQHLSAKVTINICAVLTEMFNDHGAADIIETIRHIAEDGRLEFVDSARYHAILPLIPKDEAYRQIKQNREANAHFFKDSYKPQGFFPPEMCYSKGLAGLLTEMKYKWVLLSGIACPEHWALSEVYHFYAGEAKLAVFYRDDILSNKVSFRNINAAGFISELTHLAKDRKDTYIITAMDAETFGHHIRNWERLFLAEAFTLFKKAGFKIATLSELLRAFPSKDSKPPINSSWSTSREEIAQKNYYPLWRNPGNVVHELQWEYLQICFDSVKRAGHLKDGEQALRFYDIARSLLDKAVYSCQFWWANPGRMWDINLINKGLILQEEALFNAFKSIMVSNAAEKNIRRSVSRKLAAARDISARIRDHLLANE